MAQAEHAESSWVAVPATVRFPVELETPEGFDPADVRTWPPVDGSLEWTGGRLVYMPPSGKAQGSTVGDVVYCLKQWSLGRPDFRTYTNEIGVRLGSETRGVDAAVWRAADVETDDDGVHRTPPVLAVEVAGRYDTETALRAKAQWYLSHGVCIVWIVLPKRKTVLVLTAAGEDSYDVGAALPADTALPGLTLKVSDLFRELAEEEG